MFRHFCNKNKMKIHLYKYSDPLLSTLLKHLRQLLQPRVLSDMTNTCIWGFLPFFSADPLKCCQVGWGASLHSYFQVFPEIFDWVQDGLWTFRLVLKPLLLCLDCVLRGVVLLEGEPSPQSEVLSTLEQVFNQGSLCTLLRSSFPRS